MGKIMSEDILKILENNNSADADRISQTLEAATFLADIVYPNVLERLHSLKEEEHFHILCDYDGYDVTISNDKNDVNAVNLPDLELFNRWLPNIDIEIKVEWETTGNDLFDVDGWLLTVDDQELESTGLIYIEAHLPSDLMVAKKTIKALRQEIISVLTHEFRHATQKYIWGWKNIEAISLKDHMSMVSEIDARVEEICSYSSKHINDITQEEFRSLSSKYIKRYLLRNARELELSEFNDLCENLVKTHLAYFDKRLKVSEFIEPQ
jgi:hypothetical protein